ncbi:MAG: hypothetical protein DRO40_10510 [Thermoprotei archaeon]|nr:MAG: hypothetical protein DRO40_10510 [Thermoprotei archaeon]
MKAASILVAIGVILVLLGILDTLQPYVSSMSYGYVVTTMTVTETLTVKETEQQIVTVTVPETVTETVTILPNETPHIMPAPYTPGIIQYNHTAILNTLSEINNTLYTITVIPILYWNINTSLPEYFVVLGLDIVSYSSISFAEIEYVYNINMDLYFVRLNRSLHLHIDGIDHKEYSPLVFSLDNVTAIILPYEYSYFIVINATNLLYEAQLDLQNVNDLRKLATLEYNVNCSVGFTIFQCEPYQGVCYDVDHEVREVSIRGVYDCVLPYATYYEYYDVYADAIYPYVIDVYYIEPIGEGESRQWYCPVDAYSMGKYIFGTIDELYWNASTLR